MSRVAIFAAASCLWSTLTLLSAPAYCQAGFDPWSNLPLLTAQASAPVTLNVARQKDDNSPMPVVAASAYTVTGKDMDTWKDKANGATSEFSDILVLDIVAQPSGILSGPNFRGTSTDNVATWDVVVAGLSISWDAKPMPRVTFVNTYRVRDKSDATPRYDVLNDPPVTVNQTIIRPAI